MKKYLNQTNKEDMQMHIEKALQIIDDHIPTNYVEKVMSKLPKSFKVEKSTISNLRLKKVTPLKHMIVFNALVEVALENKKEKEKLIESLT